MVAMILVRCESDRMIVELMIAGEISSLDRSRNGLWGVVCGFGKVWL